MSRAIGTVPLSSFSSNFLTAVAWRRLRTVAPASLSILRLFLLNGKKKNNDKLFVTGDNYLKPYVSCEPEVTITDRTAEDECLIIGSDGLWDVVSNETACGVARMCLKGKANAPPRSELLENDVVGCSEISDKACSDASVLLTKLALARHTSDNVSVVVVDLRRDT